MLEIPHYDDTMTTRPDCRTFASRRFFITITINDRTNMAG